MHEEYKFKYRTAGIAVWHENILLYCGEGNPYWALPGGKIDPGELSRDALKREILEEIGYDVEIGELALVSEHIFHRKMSDQLVQEVVFYYRMTFPLESSIFREGAIPGDEAGRNLIFQWHPIDSLDALVLYPEFLPTHLKSLEEGISHLYHDTTR